MTSNYLDLWDFTHNVMIGDTGLYIAVGILVIFFAGIKARMPYQALLLLCLVWGFLVYEKTRMATLWVMLILGVAFTFYLAYNKVFSR